MKQKYEYKFVRIGEGKYYVEESAIKEYPKAIDEYSQDGWRLVQIFSPPIAPNGKSKYIEFILEREIG